MEQPEVCPLCDGQGMRVVTKEGGGRLAEPCECVHQRKLYLLLRKARIPARYEACTLENYKPSGELFLAYNTARRFVDIYPGENDGTGLLFTGSIGVGKTHPATAILRKLILEKRCRRCSAATGSCSSRSLTPTIQRGGYGARDPAASL